MSRPPSACCVCRWTTWTTAAHSAPARSQKLLARVMSSAKGWRWSATRRRFSRSRVRVRLPAEALPALELAARMPQDEQLPGAGEVGAEPGQVEIRVHQLHQNVPLAHEEHREPLANPASAMPSVVMQRTGILLHRERGGEPAGAGPRHQATVRGIVVLAGQVEVAEALLRPRDHVDVVRLPVVSEALRERETLGEPAGAASGQVPRR